MMNYEISMSIAVSVGIMGCVVFVIGYWWVTRGRWVEDEVGQYFMSSNAVVAALLGIILMNLWFGPEWPGRRHVTFTLILAFIVTRWWPLRLLWLAQREKRQNGKQVASKSWMDDI